jgi:hypothetical protein
LNRTLFFFEILFNKDVIAIGTSKIENRQLSQNINNTIATKEELAQLEQSINTELENVKKSASDGKAAIATAITNKGINTASDATYAVMANNINSITTINDVPQKSAATITPGATN